MDGMTTIEECCGECSGISDKPSRTIDERSTTVKERPRMFDRGSRTFYKGLTNYKHCRIEHRSSLVYLIDSPSLKVGLTDRKRLADNIVAKNLLNEKAEFFLMTQDQTICVAALSICKGVETTHMRPRARSRQALVFLLHMATNDNNKEQNSQEVDWLASTIKGSESSTLNDSTGVCESKDCLKRGDTTCQSTPTEQVQEQNEPIIPEEKDESVSLFLDRLRIQASKCESKAPIDERILDKFFVSLGDEERIRERTEESVFAVRKKSTKKERVLTPSNQNVWIVPSRALDVGDRNKHHKIGHYGRVCIRSRTVLENGRNNKINYMAKDISVSSHIVVHPNRVDRVPGSIRVVPGYKIVVYISGHQTFDFQADRKTRPDACLHVEGYSNNIIKKLGSSKFRVRINLDVFNLNFLATTIEDQPILGLTWFNALSIYIFVKCLDTLRAGPKHILLSYYPLIQRQDVTPKIFKALNVPYSLREKLQLEITALTI
ncbi:hypothetical protein RF11_04422 [Thelohanellus kitauei]|uniref:Uncharacterized protein n=1 Tax=Thelohanellus kitauei TaxID=669202 RepID=A0A0C2MGR9_THEKT|nr:hypothetical protein RF11_04422 [Thelohanellus kitauei]